MKTKFSFGKAVAFAFLLMAGISATATPAVAKSEWLTDYTAALAQAQKENRPVLINFTGSDWCGYCIKLDKDTYSKPAFLSFAKNQLVLFEADFPRGKQLPDAVKKQNKELEEKFGVNGYPTQVLVDANGKEIARHEGYLPGGPAAFISWVETSTKK
ncbi:MAG: thioredoxin family protein [Chthoniobacterales bacterium]